MKVIVIGAGLGGLCLAHGLRASGIEVEVYERSPGTTDALAGYGIHLNARGWASLRACVPASTFARLDAAAGHSGAQFRFLDEQLRVLVVRKDAELAPGAAFDRRSVGRVELRAILADGLEDVVRWSKDFVRYETSGDRVRAFFADRTDAAGDVLVGADASHSRVRQQYLPRVTRYDLDGLNIAGRYPLTPESRALLPAMLTDGSLNSVVPARPGWMFVSAWRGESTSDGGGSYVVWAYAEKRGRFPADIERLDGRTLRDLVLERITHWAPALQTLVGGSDPATVALVPLRTMPTLAPWPPSRVTLLGDAIHNMTPMAGMGANTALRDAALLSRRLGEAGTGSRGVKEAIGAYEEEMRAYANRAVALSLRSAQQAASPSRLPRLGLRTALRIASVAPPLRRRMFADALL
jgi:2-polyprenyl-6-methoxyphenol hydroxylase-like FAD-dependent oxidoreductase